MILWELISLVRAYLMACGMKKKKIKSIVTIICEKAIRYSDADRPYNLSGHLRAIMKEEYFRAFFHLRMDDANANKYQVAMKDILNTMQFNMNLPAVINLTVQQERCCNYHTIMKHMT